MDINKGLNLDGLDVSKEHGSWSMAKNILLAEGFKGTKNEYGFDDVGSIDTFLTTIYTFGMQSKIVGVLSTDDEVIIFLSSRFLTSGETANIVRYKDGEFSLIMNASTGGALQGQFYFNPALPVDSIYTYLPNGDLVIAWCNGTTEYSIEPMILNVDRRNESVLKNNQLVNLDLLYLFPRTDHIITNAEAAQNGSLLPGVYYITARYIFIDDSFSEWCPLSEPVSIGSDPDIQTDESIIVNLLNGRDTPRKGIEIAYIRKHKGITKAYKFERINTIGSDDIQSASRLNENLGLAISSGQGVRDGGGSSNGSTRPGRVTVGSSGNTRESRFFRTSKDGDNVYTYEYNYEFVLSQTTGYEIDLDAILIKRAFYRGANSITFNKNKIYLGGILEEKTDIPYQNLADEIVVKYTAETIYQGGKYNKTFAPGEVYAPYIYFVMKDSGLITTPYNIMGRDDILPNDVADFLSLEKDTSGSLGANVVAVANINTALFANDYAENGYNQISLTCRLKSSHNTTSNDIFTDETLLIGTGFDAAFLALLTSGLNSLVAGGFNVANTPIAGGISIDITTIEPVVNSYSYSGYYFEFEIIGDNDINLTETFTRINESNINRDSMFKGGRDAGANFMGYWENEASVGGAKHHRFPTLKTIRDAATSSFGVKSFVKLGVSIENINIPTEIADRVDYFGIAFAKRTAENKMYYGESPIMPYYQATGILGNPSGDLYPTFSQYTFKDEVTPSSVNYAKVLYTKGVALSNFDILHNDLKVNITHIVPSYILNYADSPIAMYAGRSAAPDDITFYKGLIYNPIEAVNVSSVFPSETAYPIETNLIIPENAVINPKEEQSIFNFGITTDGTVSMSLQNAAVSNINNKGGSKHIMCFADAGIPSVTTGNTLSAFSSVIGRALGDVLSSTRVQTVDYQTASLKQSFDVGAIYSYKRNVYIDPSSQDLFVTKLTKVDGAGKYSVTLDNHGDCKVGQDIIKGASDYWTEAVNSPNKALAENYSRESNLIITNKFSLPVFGTFVSDVNRTYENDSVQSKRTISNIADSINFKYNSYIKSEVQYQNDYNAIQDLDIPISSKNDNIELNENKLIFSKTLNNESLTLRDLKTFFVDNYHILSSNGGEIIKIDALDNALYIQRRKGLFYAYVKDYLQTMGANTYLGTGDIFDRAPKEVTFGINRSIHCNSYMSCLLFDFGFATFDNINKKLFVFNGKELNILSNNNANNFFEKYLSFDSNYYNPYTKYALDYGDIRVGGSPDLKQGVILSYDRFNKNLHITKIHPTDTEFNLSFNFNINNFLSFHDWIGTNHAMFKDSKISFESGTDEMNVNLFTHNDQTKRAVFYDGLAKESYIDVILTDGKERTFDAINWESEVFDLNVGALVYDKTFTGIMVYNKDQCSGIIALDNPAHSSDWFRMVQRNVNDEWRFNDFRDAVIDNKLPVLSVPFRDVVSANVNATLKNWFDLNVIQGKYVVIRLIYDNEIVGGTQHEIIFNKLNVEASLLTK